MLGVTFGNKHSYNDWGVILEDTHVNPPLPKRYLVDVPARNGLLDLTPELTPTVRFESRTLTFTFRVKAGDWSTLLSTIYGDVHGQTLDVVSDLDPNWHWHGCVTVDDFSSDERTGVLVITVDADPFKLSNTENSYTVNGNGTITCVVDRMEISPAFEIEAPTTVIYGDSSYVISSSRTTEKTASGDIVSFDDGTNNLVVELTAEIEAIQTGSGDPSPANIRPISGWNGVNVFVRGKNLIYPNVKSTISAGVSFTANKDGSFTIKGTATGGIAQLMLVQNPQTLNLKGGHKYYWGFSGGDGILQIQLYTNGIYRANTTGEKVSYTIPNDTTTSYIRFRVGNGESVDCTVYPYLFLENTNVYEKQIGNNYVIPSESTIYGGVLNVGTGVLTVLKDGFVFNGTEAWVINGAGTENAYYIYKHDRFFAESGANLISSLYKTQQPTSGNTVQNVAWAYNSGGTLPRVVIRPDLSEYSTLSDWKQFLADMYSAGTPLTVVADLLEPYTVQLMPQQVQTILNKNNICADSGNVNIMYRAQDYENLKLYIPELELTEGSHSLTIQSTGTTKVTYTNGRL